MLQEVIIRYCFGLYLYIKQVHSYRMKAVLNYFFTVLNQLAEFSDICSYLYWVSDTRMFNFLLPKYLEILLVPPCSDFGRQIMRYRLSDAVASYCFYVDTGSVVFSK